MVFRNLLKGNDAEASLRGCSLLVVEGEGLVWGKGRAEESVRKEG